MKRLLALRGALALFRVSFVLQQIALALLLFLLFDLWVHIPDASILNIVESILLALFTLALAGIAEAWLILRLCDRPRTRRRLLLGALYILLSAALYLLWSALFNGSHPDDFQRAIYLNSRFPRGLRNFFSFEHITQWEQWLRTALAWIGTGIIASAVFALTAAARPLQAILCTLRSLTFWITLIFGSLAATFLTGMLINWTVGHGLRMELLSLILRVTAAALVDACIATLILCILAVCVRHTDTPSE